ncbi:MAG: phosphodiester glycosidase family protein [Armatimonadetes bacterium]|nr:phosphodiester glycosidase family protein [Armatimonadota bacterium]
MWYSILVKPTQRRIAYIVFCLAALAVLGRAGWATTVAPGVEYTVYNLPHPNVAHVVRLDLSYPEYKLKMGFAQKKRNYSSREATSTIASRYDSPPAHDVIAATNAGFFDTGITINGILGGNNNYIQLPTSTWETYMFADARWGLISRSITSSGSKVTFANATTLAIDKVNFTRSTTDQLVVYTPDWDTYTRTTVEGTEVVVSNVSYPMRPDKEVSGIVTAVRTGALSLNNAIPAGGMVLSAEGTKATTLASSVQVGDRVKVFLDVSNGSFGNAMFMLTGAGWIVHNGAAYTDMWTYYSDSFKGRNPRTMIAWNSSYLYLIAVDGRQTFSVGMSFQEMADFCTGYLNTTECINLDGGGSTTMWLNGSVVNSPSGGAERAVGNAVLLVKQNTATTFPLQDNFPSSGRTLPWDDKFVFNGVAAFSPTAPGGDGYAITVKDPSGGAETVHVGDLADTDYAVESRVYCEYRPDVAANGYERYGIYARDNGNNCFSLATLGGGYCYAMTYDSDDGQVRAAKIVNGSITDFLPTPMYRTSTAWRKMRIECVGPNIKYYLDDVLIASVLDGTFSRGYCGIGFQELFTTNSNMHGTRADNFKAVSPPTVPKVSEIKGGSIGSSVVLNGVTVIGTLPSANLFYVRDGASGIGIQKNAIVPSMPSVGQHVAIIGQTAYAASPYSHEVTVVPTQYLVMSGTSEVTPMASVNRDTGGTDLGHQSGVADDLSETPARMSAGLNDVGSLVTIWGSKTSGGLPGDRFCWIDDGSNLHDGTGRGIRVDLSELGNNLPAGAYFKITGVLRCGTSSGPEALPIRVLWPRSVSDVVPVQ